MPLGLWKSKWEIRREEMEREAAEARQFNRELLIRMEKTYANLGTTLELMGGQIELMGERIQANTEEVKAQTDAIMQLLDHLRGPNGGPPV
jgi:hypothetical protein